MTESNDYRNKILRFIGSFHSEHGYAPSFREIGDAPGNPLHLDCLLPL